MPKQSPVPDELSKPFWDACNEDRLEMQTCTACNRIQFPPEPTCYECGSKDTLEWKEVSGRGKIYSYGIMHDSRIRILQPDQPFTIALVQLEEGPGHPLLLSPARYPCRPSADRGQRAGGVRDNSDDGPEGP